MAKNNNTNIDEMIRLCKVSMCPPTVETDTDYLEKNCPLFSGSDSTRFIVEFGSSQNQVLVTEGSHIVTDQIIAYMKGVPVRSRMNGTIIEANNRYIIGIYDTDVPEIDMEALLGVKIENTQASTTQSNKSL